MPWRQWGSFGAPFSLRSTEYAGLGAGAPGERVGARERVLPGSRLQGVANILVMPNLDAAKLMRARLLAGEGKFSDAIAQVEELVKSEPDDTETQLQLALLYMQDEKLDKAIKAAIKSDVATVIDIPIDPDEDVYPFVAPGTGLKDMITGA